MTQRFLSPAGMGLVIGTLAACGLFAPARTILYEGPRGTVLLEQVPERGSTAAFRPTSGLNAAHPVFLEPPLLVAVLRGIQIQPAPRPNLPPVASETPRPVFTDEEAAFLAPLLSTALLKASPSEYVIFQLHQAPLGFQAGRIGAPDNGSSTPVTSSVRPESTSGALYVYGRSLHVTLTAYRHATDQPALVHAAERRLADPAGLAGSTVSFTPRLALRPDLYRQSVLPLPSDLPSLVIDYHGLARMAPDSSPPTRPEPPPAAAPALPSSETPPPASAVFQESDELRELKDLVIKKDLELERLREELRRLKQQAPKPGPPPRSQRPAKPLAPQEPASR